MLREAAPEATIGFFLHIPFPPSEMFRILPRREEVLRGLLGADLLAFQTHADLQHFRSLAAAHPGPATAAWTGVAARDGRTRGWRRCPSASRRDEFAGLLRDDPDDGRRAARTCASASRAAASCWRWTASTTPRASPSGCARSGACWRRAPQLRGQGRARAGGGALAREHPASTTELRRQVNELVGELNGDFGTPGLDARRLHPPRHPALGAGGPLRRRPTWAGSRRCATA